MAQIHPRKAAVFKNNVAEMHSARDHVFKHHVPDDRIRQAQVAEADAHKGMPAELFARTGKTHLRAGDLAEKNNKRRQKQTETAHTAQHRVSSVQGLRLSRTAILFSRHNNHLSDRRVAVHSGSRRFRGKTARQGTAKKESPIAETAGFTLPA